MRTEVRGRTIGYILTALGLVAGLAWNDAIKALIEKFLTSGNSLIAKFGYAIFITVIVVILSVYLARLLGSEDKK